MASHKDLYHLLHVYNSLIMGLFIMVTIAMGVRLVNGDPLFKVYHDYWLELRWTATPATLVIAVTIPSVWYLYWIESPRLGKVFTVIGNQWYWIYRSSKLLGHTAPHYDSIYADGKLTAAAVNMSEHMFMVSSNDVIHNWGVAGCYRSALGLKMDAYPGRLNVAFLDGELMAQRQSLYLRYCSELCGIYHAYMPIAIVISR